MSSFWDFISTSATRNQVSESSRTLFCLSPCFAFLLLCFIVKNYRALREQLEMFAVSKNHEAFVGLCAQCWWLRLSCRAVGPSSLHLFKQSCCPCSSAQTPVCTLSLTHSPPHSHTHTHAHSPTQGLNNCDTAWVKGFLSQQDKACDTLAVCALSDCMCPLWSRCELGLVHPGPDLPPGFDPYSAPQWSGGPHQELQVCLK